MLVVEPGCLVVRLLAKDSLQQAAGILPLACFQELDGSA